MADRTGIEWTDATWNPVTGCTEVSPGCDHCYARTFAERWRGIPGHHFEHGFDVQLREDKLTLPLTWRRPRRVFVNSMSDLFHTDVPDDYIARVFAVMAATPRHTYQVLTKRHGRMRSLLNSQLFIWAVQAAWDALDDDHRLHGSTPPTVGRWPLPNVWLGVSVEDQKWADLRVPALLDTPATVRFLSCEPLLGPVDASRWLGGRHFASTEEFLAYLLDPPAALDWVIVGGESGTGARPMHPQWARSLHGQCVAAGVPFVFKQWGEWAPDEMRFAAGSGPGPARRYFPDGSFMRRVGKRRAGRVLDGRTWHEFPAGRGRTA